MNENLKKQLDALLVVHGNALWNAVFEMVSVAGHCRCGRRPTCRAIGNDLFGCCDICLTCWVATSADSFRKGLAVLDPQILKEVCAAQSQANAELLAGYEVIDPVVPFVTANAITNDAATRARLVNQIAEAEIAAAGE